MKTGHVFTGPTIVLEFGQIEDHEGAYIIYARKVDGPAALDSNYVLSYNISLPDDERVGDFRYLDKSIKTPSDLYNKPAMKLQMDKIRARIEHFIRARI